MGHIKEPDGVDLVIGPSKITEEEKNRISWIIQYFKRTGKKPSKKQVASLQETPTSKRKRRTTSRKKINDSK